MIPEALKTEIDKRAMRSNDLFEQSDEEWIWAIKIDDLKKILENWFKETPY